jgi:hypothetical protein
MGERVQIVLATRVVCRLQERESSEKTAGHKLVVELCATSNHDGGSVRQQLVRSLPTGDVKDALILYPIVSA